MLFYKLNTDVSTDKDGNSKVKVNVKDSNGTDFEVSEQGDDLLKLFEKVIKDFDNVNIKTKEEKKTSAPNNSTETLLRNNSVETLLRRKNIELRTKNEQLQQEVIKLAQEVNKLTELLEKEKTKNVRFTPTPTFSMDKLNEGEINDAYLNSITDFLTGIF